MRRYSTPQSAEDGEVSALAIFETVLAVGFSLWLIVVKDVVFHVLLGAVVAPFLLLRTDRSTRLGIAICLGASEIREELRQLGAKDSDRLGQLIIYWILGFFGWVISAAYLLNIIGIIARVLAVVISFVQAPLDSLAAIPRNWRRIALSVDIAHPPEYVPGTELVPEETRGLVLFSDIIKRQSIALLGIAIYLYLPSILYRYSLKAVTVVYLPFIWIASANSNNRQDQQFALLEIQAERLKRSYAILVLLSLGCAVVYYAVYQRWYYPLEKGQAFTQYWIPIDFISSWHFTRVVAALLTLLIGWYAHRVLLRQKINRTYDISGSVFWLTVCKRLRVLCTIWTIGCGLYLAYHAVDWSTLPEWIWIPSPDSRYR